MVVEHRRATGERELGEPGARGRVLRLRVDARPDRVELAQPREEVGLLRPRARQRLVEVMVGVHEPGRDDLASEVDALAALGLRACTDVANETVFDEEPAARVLAPRVVQRHDVRVGVERAHTSSGTSSNASTSTRP